MTWTMTSSLDPSFQSQKIKERALAEGFDKVGIVRADALLNERPFLEEWLRRGYHGEMSWMARDSVERTDPHKVFPSAQSVVVVALNYFTPHKHVTNDRSGKISRYAWGDDYHVIVREKLKSLLEWIKEQWPETEGKTCVDIQPMMDKAWAVRAGLGWIGKHTNLITRDLGSWVFIGELLLNLELEYDNERVEDYCGSCTLCLEACPTDAIVEPYVVDSNKCISYATIESRAPEMSREIADNLEGWFYGCDICQEVCPWNRFEQATTEIGFQPRAGDTSVDLQEILDLSPKTYAARFRGTPIKRAKLSGLQRNAQALIESENQEK